MESDKKIAVIDFGGQYSHLIASRVRRLGAYTEICSNEDPVEKFRDYAGVILSGGPSSVYSPNAPGLDPGIYGLGIPVLGICYGLQITVHSLGGNVEKSASAEYGPAKLDLSGEEWALGSPMTEGIHSGKKVWMSHGDEVVAIPEGFQIYASSSSCRYAMIGDANRNIFGIQFHPEVTHTEQGNEFLRNFIRLCGVSNTWGLDRFIEEEMEVIRSHVRGDRKVFLLVSGGVDSTVAYLLLARALGKDRVKGLLVDTGFMRKSEVKDLKENLRQLGFDLWIRDESEVFYSALEGLHDPEEKRMVVGNLFLDAQGRAVKELELDPEVWLLGQGTIYPDTIESGGTKHSHKIKTHHNRVPAIQKLLDEGKIIEPLRDLYKDEVRELGVKLGLAPEWTGRHPFPGPGLVVRMIATKKKIPHDLEKKIQNDLATKNSSIKVRILPFPSVGVQGDQRSYANCLLFNDFSRDWEELDTIATEATNRYREVNRVVFAPDSKSLPAEYLYSELPLDRAHSDLLREADHRVFEILHGRGIHDSIWQMPVVLVPCGKKSGEYSVVLRPVESNEAMTASFYRMDRKILTEMRESLQAIPGISDVFFDLTNKPPGTIEWE